MTIRYMTILFFTTLLFAQHNRTTCLIDAPEAYILPHLTYRLSLAGSMPQAPGLLPPQQRVREQPRYDVSDVDFALAVGLFDRVEVSLSMYTPKDYALGLSYQLLKETSKRPALAIGVHEVNWKRHISSVGGGYDRYGNPIGWDYDVEYYHQIQGLLPSENFSLFMVMSKEFWIGEETYLDTVVTPSATYTYKWKAVSPIFGLHLGLGRGRYVGYGPHSHLTNTDGWFFGTSKDSPKHDWALGVFGGIEFFPGGYFSPALEYDGRDFNAGISSRFLIAHRYIHLYFSVDKIESYFWGGGKYFHRLAAGIALQVPPDTSSALTGLVYDDVTNEPIQGAVVTLVNTRIPPATSNHSGRYLFERVPPKRLTIRVEKSGYIPRVFEVSIRPRRRAVADLPLHRWE